MKNIILFASLTVILVSAFFLYHPEPATMVIAAIISIGKIGFSIAVFHEYMRRTLLVLIITTVGLTLLTGLVTTYFILIGDVVYGVDFHSLTTIANLKALAWVMFFSVIVLDVHFLYVWFFEKPTTELSVM